jgi:glyoxylase-like metal-dependent hydrolase (beta-lactamase superfamily II)
MSLLLGPHRLDALEPATFALDGGAMFGIVPKPLWEQKIPADARNRIRQALRCLLVRSNDRTVLVDTGIGDKWSEKERGIYDIEALAGIDGELARLGLDRSRITDVILTHLHFDHAGGATVRDAEGREQLAFPNATYHVQRRNWAWAHHPSEKDAGSYRPENYRALETSGRLHLVEGETELFPGIRLIVSEGHTVGLQLVRVESGDRWLTYCADLIPTSAHLKPSWGMAYDLHPLTVIEEKKMLVAEAIADHGMLMFEHDPRVQACTVREEGGEVRVDEEVRLS